LFGGLAAPAVANPDVWGTGSASLSTDPGFEGYWKYCYEVDWVGLPHGVSHVDILLWLLQDCECVCSPGYFAFADTTGSGPGTPNGEPCMVYYYGLFECFGDPSIDIDGPLVKFEPYEDHCEPGAEGWVRACFYSVAAPIPAPAGEWVVIKFAREYATGPLTGVMPGCDSAYSARDNVSWGQIKALYR
jgi:hypothetical protein